MDNKFEFCIDKVLYLTSIRDLDIAHKYFRQYYLDNLISVHEYCFLILLLARKKERLLNPLREV